MTPQRASRPRPTPATAETSDEQLGAKALARRHRDALRRRARRIRRTIIACALALFTAAFVGIYVQMATGHDPALNAASRRSATSTTLAASGETAKTATTSSGETGESASSSSASSESNSSESSASGSSATESSGGETGSSSVTTSQS